MKKLFNIYIFEKKKKKFNKIITIRSRYKYNDTPFIYFNNNKIEIIELKERRDKK